MKHRRGAVVEDPDQSGLGTWLLLNVRYGPNGARRLVWSGLQLIQAPHGVWIGFSDYFSYDDELNWNILFEGFDGSLPDPEPVL